MLLGCRRVGRACQDPGGIVTSGRIPRLSNRWAAMLIVARRVHAVEEQSGSTERMVVPAGSVNDTPPAERLDLDVAFGQPLGTAACSAA